MTFNPSQKARTRLGQQVEIIAVLGPGSEDSQGDAIIGLVVGRDGQREIMTWRRNGRFRADKPSSLDLENEPNREMAGA